MEKIKETVYRLLSLILTMVMISGSFNYLGLEVEAENQMVFEKVSTGELGVDLPENDELFAGYAEQIFYEQEKLEVCSIGEQIAGLKLEGDEKQAYDALISVIREIAEGKRSSTRVDLGKGFSYQGTYYNPDVEVVFHESSQTFDLDALLNALLTDYPYELYWYDKITGCSIVKWSDRNNTLSYVEFYFYVAGNYQNGNSLTVNTEYAVSAKTAAENAKTIVGRHAAKSDYEKLSSYRDEICDLVTYDSYAADSGNFSVNNNPWQLISVFDQDQSTNVVCEGYSKAFQYLCDLSTFVGNDTTCYSATGWMASTIDSGGAHMWNIVLLNGNNYLVDITNCDTGSIGYPDLLFMAGADRGTINDGYIFDIDSVSVGYQYDTDTLSTWGTEALTLSDADYTPPVVKATSAVKFETTVETVSYTGEEVKITAPVVTVNGEVAEEVMVSYRYRISGSIADYTSGLPTEAGVYEVLATVEESDAYTGSISNVLTLIIEREEPGEEPGDEPENTSLNAPELKLARNTNGEIYGVEITSNVENHAVDICYGYRWEEANQEVISLNWELFEPGETKVVAFMDLLVPECEIESEISFIAYVKCEEGDCLDELSDRTILDYPITMSEKSYTGGNILIEVEIDDENQEIYWIEEAMLPSTLRVMYLTNSEENVNAGSDAIYYFAPPWPVEGRTCWGASYTDAKISVEKLTLGEVIPEETGLRFVWSDVPKELITVQREKVPVQYTINYVLNGGVNAMENPSVYCEGSSVVFMEPSKAGYTFAGWYSDSKLKKPIAGIQEGTAGDKTVYAKWTLAKYSIHYQLNGGKNNASNPSKYSITTKTTKLKNPTRKGYTFEGWYTDSDYNTRITEIVKGSFGTIQLYAKWETIEYGLSYVLNGGTNHEANPAVYNVEFENIVLEEPVKEGYVFKGWFSDSKFKKKVKTISQGSTGNKKFYAKWAAEKYAVTYHLDGGKNNSSNPSTYSITTKTVKLKNPTKKGYVFDGWYLDELCTVKAAEITKGSIGAKEFYAKWVECEYTITYYLNGGENHILNPDSYGITTPNIVLENPTKEGYTFKGWYSDSKFKKKVVTITEGSTGNKKLYARWKRTI